MSPEGLVMWNVYSDRGVDLGQYYGKTIKDAVLNNERLEIRFEDFTEITLWDSDQQCCESRYTTCEDDLYTLVGAELKEIRVSKGPKIEDRWEECHEQLFLDVITDKGKVQLVTHNEHNGYYGGFSMMVSEGKWEED